METPQGSVKKEGPPRRMRSIVTVRYKAGCDPAVHHSPLGNHVSKEATQHDQPLSLQHRDHFARIHLPTHCCFRYLLRTVDGLVFRYSLCQHCIRSADSCDDPAALLLPPRCPPESGLVLHAKIWAAGGCADFWYSSRCVWLWRFVWWCV